MTGLVLLTGGRGRRMGSPKHVLAHPRGGTWGGHLVRVFESVFPGGPILLLGEPLPERPELAALQDPRQGPAEALRLWAAVSVAEASRWWIVACDQVRWDADRLGAWSQRALAADPGRSAWVVARHGGHLQPLGGFLPGSLRPAMAALRPRSLMALVEALPHVVVDAEGPEWRDLDTASDLQAFEAEEGP
jgi:molybdopterin-guanine dinucleotide biosynthesis protein A